jgi:hypothetical protein
MADFRIQRFKHTWKGAWNSQVTYNADDVVSLGGKIYNCLVRHESASNFYQDLNFTNSDIPPLPVPRWELMADGVSLEGEWQTQTEYFVGDIVKNGSVSYICVENHFSSADITGFKEDYIDEEYWIIFLDSSSWKNEWTTDFYYKVGDVVKFSGKVYRCLEDHESASSFDDGLLKDITKWQTSLVGNAWLSDWQPTTLYFERDLVRYGGIVYRCVNQHESSDIIDGLESNETDWEIVVEGIEYKNAWQPGTRYKKNDIVRYGPYLYKANVGHNTLSLDTFNVFFWDIFCPGQEYEEIWNSSSIYRPGEIVTHGGYLFVANITNTNSIPDYDFVSTNPDWELLFKGTRIRGSWNINSTYNIGDLVRRNGQLYTARKNVPAGQDTDILGDGSSINSDYWELVVPGINWRGNWQEKRTYLIGDLILWRGASYRCVVKHFSSESNRPDNNEGNEWEQYTYGDPNNQLSFIGDLKYFGVTEDGSTVGVTRLPIGTDAQTIQSVSNEPIWSNFNASDKVYFVDLEGVDRPDRGSTSNAPWRTVRYALEHIQGPATVFIRTGIFEEVLPLRVPANVAVVGEELRSTVVTTVEELFSSTEISMFQSWIDYFFSIVDNILLKNPVDPVLGEGFQSFDGPSTTSAQSDVVKTNLTIIKSLMSVKTAITRVSTNVETINADDLSAIEILENNAEFLKEEFIGFLKENYPLYTIEKNKSNAIIERLVNALSYDLRFEGNHKTIETGEYFYNASHAGENKRSNMFLLANGTGLRNMTLTGLSGQLGQLNPFLTRRPTAGAYASLDPGWGKNDDSVWITNKSPYVQNVTTFGTGCIGLKVDGELHNGGNKSIVANDFTQILSDGIGAWCNKDGLSELVSVFTYYNHIGYLCTDGGKIRGTNGNCSYGKFGAVAESFNPTETPISAKVNNRYFDATVDQVFTKNGEIIKLFFDHSGQDYNNVSYSLSGTGIGASLSGDEFRDQSVYQSRVFAPGDSSSPGGSGYTLLINNAQIGDRNSITLSASTDDTPDTFRGLRISIETGTGSGQYGYIVDYNNSTKIALVGNEFYDPFTITTSNLLGNTLITGSTEGLKVNDAVCFTGTLFGNVVENTVYYINSVTPSQIVISDSLGGSDFVLTDDAGSMLLHKLGWTVYQPGIPLANLLDTTTSYRIEPRIIFSPPDNNQTQENLGGSNDWSDVAYGNGVFVAITGYSGLANSTFSYSTTGSSWNTITVTPGIWSRIKFGNGLFVAVSRDGKSMRSSDGIVWIDNTVPDLEYTGLAFGNGTWIAVASGTDTAIKSSNGLNWVEFSIGEGADWSDIVYGKGIFVAIAQGDSTSVDRAYSTDSGVTWTTGTFGGGSKSITYGNNRFVAVSGGYVGASDVYISFDGINWIVGSIEPADWQRVVYGQGKFMAVAYGTDYIAESNDGLDWRLVSIGSTKNHTSITFGNPDQTPKFITVSENDQNSLVITRGTRAQGRLRVSSGRASGISLWEQGSGYSNPPMISVIDPNNSTDAVFENRIANGVLGNPSIVSPGIGWITLSARCTLTGDGFADRYQLGNRLVIQNATRIPGPGSNLLIGGINDYVYRVLDATVLNGGPGNYELNLLIAKSLQLDESPDHLTDILIREQYSQVRLTGHDFLDIGLGNFEQSNYPNTLFPVGTVLAPEDETKESDGGRVFYTSTDQDGNFRVGELFAVEQSTGTVTISAEFFQLEGLEEIALGGVSVGGSGVVIREFSTDPLFIADSNNILSTQKAVKEFISRRVSGGGSDAFTGQFTAGIIRVGPNSIATVTGEPINIPVKVAFNAPFSGSMLVNSYFLAGTGFVNEDPFVDNK